MKFEHFITTQFSYRDPARFGPLSRLDTIFESDPLNPKKLAQRFRLFETACLPSVLAQSTQDFSWILIIDRALPPELRERLRDLVAAKRRVFLYEFEDHETTTGPRWLDRFLEGAPDYVLTTQMDDDDALPRGYCAALHQHISETADAGPLPPLKFLGSRKILQWDLACSEQAPLGWRSPWHMGGGVASCGFSVLSRVANRNFNSLKLSHSHADAYLDFSVPAQHAGIERRRESFIQFFEDHGDSVGNWDPADLFHDMGTDVEAVVMTNHGSNRQFARVHRSKADHQKVTGAESFPDVVIDWASAEANAAHFTIPTWHRLHALLKQKL
jgi:hypothetical protein